MIMKNTLLAAAVVAAFAVPATFAASTSTTNANFGQVMTSIQGTKTTAPQIQGLTTVKTVNVVKVGELSDISQGTNKTDFDNAVTQNDADITQLRTAITSNAAVNAAVNSALQQQNVDVNSVVAADVQSDGTLTVYVR